MLYSVTQQVIRQDLGHWLAYVAARPDHCPTLISFLYYAKYVFEEDTGTAFQHIDLNIDLPLATGRGINAIQGSVSLDNKSAKAGCTELVKGFHNYIGAWWRKVREQAAASNTDLGAGGLTQELKRLYAAADAAEYGRFIPVPCVKLGVRITQPDIIHGSMKSSGSSIRRTVLPWYVAIAQDGFDLDVQECDSYPEVANAHFTQMAPRTTPSGHPNKYGKIPYRFPPSVKVISPTVVGQALVCQRTWTDPLVVRSARVLLGNNRSAAQDMINRHRAELLAAFKAAYDEQKQAEMELFDDNSYFKNLIAAV